MTESEIALIKALDIALNALRFYSDEKHIEDEFCIGHLAVETPWGSEAYIEKGQKATKAIKEIENELSR